MSSVTLCLPKQIAQGSLSLLGRKSGCVLLTTPTAVIIVSLPRGRSAFIRWDFVVRAGITGKLTG